MKFIRFPPWIRALGRIGSIAAIVAFLAFCQRQLTGVGGDTTADAVKAYALIAGSLALFVGVAAILWGPPERRMNPLNVWTRIIVAVGPIVAALFLIWFVYDLSVLWSSSARSVLLQIPAVRRVLVVDFVGIVASLVTIAVCLTWTYLVSTTRRRMQPLEASAVP